MADTELAPEQDPQDVSSRDRAAILAAFLLLLRDTQTHLAAQVQKYNQGQISIVQLSDALTAALLGAHTHATYLGRRLAGNTAPLGLQDNQFAQTVLMQQSRYLSGLVSDIANGRYAAEEDDGALSPALLARLCLYARGLRGTANEAWARSLDPETLIDWVLGPTEHCSDCDELAAGSPYKAGELHQFPGDGGTICLANCACDLQTVTGAEGFPLED